MKTFWTLFAGFSFLILLSFGIWGDALEALFNAEQTQEYLISVRNLAGPLGAGLLVSDLFLPIPTTVIIGALGATLGLAWGAFWGWLGLVLAGWTGYLLARWSGSRWRATLISTGEEKRFGHFLEKQGSWAIVLSRMLPVLPEVLSILAGLYGMPASRFGAALTLGSLPPAILYAWAGSTAKETPLFSVILVIGITGLMWVLYLRLRRDGVTVEKD